ncbi:hypothetical protein [Neobacillus niacini]|uniref:hypothetical protein n=1 Tax=Neobacillus niacini TaxID=86668 RepID=UPI00286AAF45|nr:hypothetical protein [Neobacillus niacini]
MAFDLSYSIDCFHLLKKRFIEHYKLIRYNPEIGELSIKNWGTNLKAKVRQLKTTHEAKGQSAGYSKSK